MRFSLHILFSLLATSVLALPTPEAETDLTERWEYDPAHGGSLAARMPHDWHDGERDYAEVRDFEARDLDFEDRDFDIEDRDIDIDDRDLDIEDRDFDIEDRDFDIDDRDLDERDLHDGERDYAEVREFEEREFDAEERDFDVEERDEFMLDKRAPLNGAQVTASSNANLIKALQYLLVARKHKVDVDGKYGPKTKAAVTAFQKGAKLTADGQAGPATLGALFSVVQAGSKGDFVKAAQSALNANGAKLAVDGNFGAGTKAAAVAFQKKKGLGQDGIVGPATWTALFGGKGGSTQPPTTGGSCDSVKAGVAKSQTVVAASNIRVNKCLSSRVAKMVADAKKAGVSLSANSSWRDPAQQIALRKQNCGTSHYDIYQKPSSQCSPNTAIPGTSRHERGLAIDFANCQKGTKAYNWLVKNASKYHLKNLVTGTESWHWSWDGN